MLLSCRPAALEFCFQVQLWVSFFLIVVVHLVLVFSGCHRPGITRSSLLFQFLGKALCLRMLLFLDLNWVLCLLATALVVVFLDHMLAWRATETTRMYPVDPLPSSHAG